MIKPILSIIVFCFIVRSVNSQTSDKGVGLDVLTYTVNLDVDIENKSIQGDVVIAFELEPKITKVIFNSGSLKITNVFGATVTNYEARDQKLIITLAKRTTSAGQVQIFYNGKPSNGLVFPAPGQAHTVYFTSEWMICNDTPSDKAKCALNLTVPAAKTCVASGTFVNKKMTADKVLYSWNQDYETPPYTYGFAIGTFNTFEEKHGAVVLQHYSDNYTPRELETIFQKTGDMIDFFEQRSGIRYVQNSYSQILIGNHYQEMSGFAVLRDSYGKMVLQDSTETSLISHELAHQWWGNSITCASWNHFWLNEGFATFMSAAYNEHRFGKQKYTADIDSYFKVYKTIKDSGKDKSLVFTDWSRATKDDRNLVYFKGAYALHLLRIELGEQHFWEGIKRYSQKYFGKSVDTFEFQKTMEETSGRSLQVFFEKWVYLKRTQH
ncbi:M1 family aminopeptidase [Pseudochryseolinea flava]|uniref:Aminopeptidase N n=1 Tax=Pseudochryseolinea flava TaxID=2059302 RepID=A0A364Y1M8_9BACT|nr:M1 family aminopeptidase [Pseudochryseolinea flava]RAW00743.1 aminopeptidase [Pseudochryseolinea flava]